VRALEGLTDWSGPFAPRSSIGPLTATLLGIGVEHCKPHARLERATSSAWSACSTYARGLGPHCYRVERASCCSRCFSVAGRRSPDNEFRRYHLVSDGAVADAAVFVLTPALHPPGSQYCAARPVSHSEADRWGRQENRALEWPSVARYSVAELSEHVPLPEPRAGANAAPLPTDRSFAEAGRGVLPSRPSEPVPARPAQFARVNGLTGLPPVRAERARAPRRPCRHAATPVTN
jgi:hypothetical protein